MHCSQTALKILLCALCICATSCLFSQGRPLAKSSTLQIECIAVGQGNACLLRDNGQAMLLDAGPDSAGLLDSLRARGIDTLDGILLSHGHRDHCGGVWDIADSLVIKQIWVGKDTVFEWSMDSTLRVASHLGIPVDTLSRGDTLPALGPWQSRILWPPSNVMVGDNGASLVVLVGEGSASFLYVGDLGFEGEAGVLAREPDLHAALLQVGHHGSATSSSIRWLGQVNPDYAIICVGANNDYGHPTAETLARLQLVIGDSSHILRTDLDGTVNFTLSEGFGIWRTVTGP